MPPLAVQAADIRVAMLGDFGQAPAGHDLPTWEANIWDVLDRSAFDAPLAEYEVSPGHVSAIVEVPGAHWA
jgi:hypothetical protein